MSDKNIFEPSWFDGEEHDDAVPFDRFDQHGWATMSREQDALRDMLADWRDKYDYAADFAQDAFNLIQKGAPRVRQPEEMKPTRVPQRHVTEDLASMPAMDDLRQYTVGDPFNTTLAVVGMRETLEAALDAAKELAEAAEAAEKAQQDAQGSGDPDAMTAAQSALDTLTSQAAAQAAANRKGIRDAVKEAAKDAGDLEQAMLGYGVDPGEAQRMSFAERSALARRLMGEKLRKFSQLIGAFRTLAAAESRRKFSAGSDEITGVVLGDDLHHLTTAEVISQAVPEMEEDFWRRYAERELLVYELKARERVARGPVVVLADESGSMNGAGEMWAKGLALALMDQCRRGGRDFTYIGFSSRNDIREFHFPKGKGSTEQVLDMVEIFLGGGTDVERPLRRALDIVTGADEKRPDVVLISDGEAPMPAWIDEWHAARDKLSMKTYGIYVNSWGGLADSGLEFLGQVCDNVRLVGDLLDVHQVSDILREA